MLIYFIVYIITDVVVRERQEELKKKLCSLLNNLGVPGKNIKGRVVSGVFL